MLSTTTAGLLVAMVHKELFGRTTLIFTVEIWSKISASSKKEKRQLLLHSNRVISEDGHSENQLWSERVCLRQKENSKALKRIKKSQDQ